jgi:hypothetical protein
MMDLKLNKKRLALHWQYYRARYFLFLALALIGAAVLYSMTAPKTPAARKVDIYVVASALTTDDTARMQQEILSMLPLDQLEVNIYPSPIIQGQEDTLDQVIMARISSGEGDFWIMPADMFAKFAQQNAFRVLDGELSGFNLPKGIDLSAGTAVVQADANTPGAPHVCGIPLDSFRGLEEMFIPDGMILAFPQYPDVNYANAKLAANWVFSKIDAPRLLAASNSQVNLTISSMAVASGAEGLLQKALEGVLPSGQAVYVSALPYRTGREDVITQLVLAQAASAPGSLCVVPQAAFTALARAGALRALDGEMQSFALPQGEDLSGGRESATNAKTASAGVHQYGIPLDNCYGLSRYFNPAGSMLVFLAGADANPANSLAAANWLLAQTR